MSKKVCFTFGKNTAINFLPEMLAGNSYNKTKPADPLTLIVMPWENVATTKISGSPAHFYEQIKMLGNEKERNNFRSLQINKNATITTIVCTGVLIKDYWHPYIVFNWEDNSLFFDAIPARKTESIVATPNLINAISLYTIN